MTAAKMVLHDWQRGKIPFFVPPPRQAELPEETDVSGADRGEGVENSQASAAFRAIADVISSQQQRSVPVQRDLFSENELEGDTDAVQLAAAETDIPEPLPATTDGIADELPASES